MNITATEVDLRWIEWWCQWQEAEARLIEPILDEMLRIARQQLPSLLPVE